MSRNMPNAASEQEGARLSAEKMCYFVPRTIADVLVLAFKWKAKVYLTLAIPLPKKLDPKLNVITSLELHDH